MVVGMGKAYDGSNDPMKGVIRSAFYEGLRAWSEVQVAGEITRVRPFEEFLKMG